MRLCDICGNEVEDTAWKCPFCESMLSGQTAGQGRKRKAAGVLTINLKEDLPTTEEARLRLERGLASARYQNARIVRVIHGYGSSGTGGRIKGSVRAALKRMQAAKKIKGSVPGDDYSDRTNAGRELIQRHPALKKSIRTDSDNPGITFVEI